MFDCLNLILYVEVFEEDCFGGELPYKYKENLSTMQIVFEQI